MPRAASIPATPSRAIALLLSGALMAAGMLLMLQIVTAFSAFAAPATPAGIWLAEDISGGGVIDRAQTTLTLALDGAISGSGGCNRYRGKAVISGSAISFGPLAATRAACPPAVMNQENRFFSALAATRGWRIDEQERKLFLVDGAGKVLVRLAEL